MNSDVSDMLCSIYSDHRHISSSMARQHVICSYHNREIIIKARGSHVTWLYIYRNRYHMNTGSRLTLYCSSGESRQRYYGESLEIFSFYNMYVFIYRK